MWTLGWTSSSEISRLNEVRPRRPEQFGNVLVHAVQLLVVSMKSGLEGRNNQITAEQRRAVHLSQ